jgi:hypothetical protein
MARISITKVQLGREIIDRKDWIKYLVIPDWHGKQLGDVIEKVPDAAFNKFVEGHVQAYLDGKAPPSAILSAVMNIADDYVTGQGITARAGDYIALQNAYRAK